MKTIMDTKAKWIIKQNTSTTPMKHDDLVAKLHDGGFLRDEAEEEIMIAYWYGIINVRNTMVTRREG